MEFLNSLSSEWKTLTLVILFVLGGIILTKVIRWLIDKSFVTASEKLNVDATRYKFFKNAASLIIWIVVLAAIVSLVPRLKALAITLFAGAGIFMAIVGLAAQQAFSNIVSGLFIVMFKPFRVGDKIKVGTQEYGIVEDITLRHTIINNYENKRIIIPNAVISSETITNDTIVDSLLCVWLEFGISYDSNVDLAIKIIQEEAVKHPFWVDGRTSDDNQHNDDPVSVRIISYGDFSVNLRAYVWMNEPYRVMQLKSDLNYAIKKRFDAEGIEIPFPYRTLVYKNDLPKNA